MSADKVEVVGPLQVTDRQIQQFVTTKQQWILQALQKMQTRTTHPTGFAPAVYQAGAEVVYQGQSCLLAVQPSKLKTIKIEFNGQLLAHIPQALLEGDYSLALKNAVTRWLKKQALLKVQQLVQQHGQKKQLWPRSLSIKTQKSRWGSCGIHNDVHMNWLLIMAPPEVLEYVVVHELCHIQVRNHSQHFWALVTEHLPNYKQARQWLKKNGAGLMASLG